MSWRMMFSILRRNALMPALVMLQVMLACAILCNVVYLAWQKVEPMVAPSGVDQANLILISGLSPRAGMWSPGTIPSAVVTLQHVPGVRSVSAALGLPMMTNMYNVVALEGPSGAKLGVSVYAGKHLVDTLGLDLVAGRDFLASEYVAQGDKRAGALPIIITRSLANQLFSDGHAVGKLLHRPKVKDSGPGYRVVGVVAHLLRSRIGAATKGRADNTILEPGAPLNFPFINLAVRVKPAMRDAALKSVREAVKDYFGPLMKPGSKPRVEFYDTIASSVFASRRHALWLFAGIAVIVLAVAVMGIMGLTGFWVQRRTRQIGIRRALGAKRRDVLRDFMLENALIVGIAIVLGMILAYGGNRFLMSYYELDRLPLAYLPIGAAIMLVLGQLAVLGPALRAARVPPAMATRAL